MADVNLLVNALNAVTETLQEKALRPEPERSDWASVRPALDRLEGQVETLLTRWSEVVPMLASAAEAEAAAVSSAVARAVADGAAVLYLAGTGRPSDLMRRAARIGGDTVGGRLAAAGGDAPAEYARLTWAEWLFQAGKGRKGRSEAEALTKRSSGVIAEAAAALLDMPMPTKKPPTLQTVNGIGTTVYGKRDARPDGSYVKTRYFALVFVPVLPLDAWRVREAPGEGWYFLGKVPLGPVAKWWRRGLAAAVALMVLSGLWSSWYDAPERRFDRAVTAAAQEADPAAKRAALEAVARDFEGERVDQARVAGPLVELAAAAVPAEPSLADASAMEATIARIEGLPEDTREAAGDAMARVVLGWVEAIGTADDAALGLGASLAKRASGLAEGGAVKAEAEAAWASRMTEKAEALAAEWPIEAVHAYARIGSAEAIGKALALIEALDPGMSVWVELRPSLTSMRTAAPAAGVETAALDAALSEATRASVAADDPARQALLDADDEAALRAGVAAAPGDHALAARLAELLAAQGDVAGAEAVLSALGSPGQMAGPAQRALADLWAAEGKLAEADAVLTRVVAARLPRFEAARRAYEQAADAFRDRKIAELERPGIATLHQAVIDEINRAATDEEKSAIFVRWLGEQMDRDETLGRLRAAYSALGDVVPAALSLGTLKLRRANGASGEARARLLAEAEAAFLSIQAEAKGVASYHLGLGQVYHRLGKIEEGDAEFEGLLQRGEPALSLAVAQAYRELGLEQRARAEAEKLVDAPAPVGSSAAITLALLARDNDEKRSWLEKADQSMPFVRNELLSLEAEALLEEGDRAAADRKFAEVAAAFEQDAANNASAANNAALVLLRRYDCTGDAKHLTRAVQLMEGARELEPDNGIMIGNLADVREMAVTHAALAQWLPLDRLGLTGSELSSVLDAMLDGPMRGEVRAALGRSPQVRRLLELVRQAEVLAPNRPESWGREVNWLVRLDDTAGLVALRARMKGVALDHAAREAMWRSRIAAGADPETVEAALATVARLDARLAAVGGVKPARAVLSMLRGEALYGLAYWAGDAARAAEAAEAFDAAAAAWPGIGAVDARANAKVAAALFAHMAGDAGLTAAWTNEGRALGLMLFARDRAGLDALGEAPAVTAAAALRREQLGSPDLDAWMLGALAGDAALEQAAAPARSAPRTRAMVEVSQMMAPYQPGHAARLALLR